MGEEYQVFDVAELLIESLASSLYLSKSEASSLLFDQNGIVFAPTGSENLKGVVLWLSRLSNPLVAGKLASALRREAENSVRVLLSLLQAGVVAELEEVSRATLRVLLALLRELNTQARARGAFGKGLRPAWPEAGDDSGFEQHGRRGGDVNDGGILRVEGSASPQAAFASWFLQQDGLGLCLRALEEHGRNLPTFASILIEIAHGDSRLLYDLFVVHLKTSVTSARYLKVCIQLMDAFADSSSADSRRDDLATSGVLFHLLKLASTLAQPVCEPRMRQLAVTLLASLWKMFPRQIDSDIASKAIATDVEAQTTAVMERGPKLLVRVFSRAMRDSFSPLQLVSLEQYEQEEMKRDEAQKNSQTEVMAHLVKVRDPCAPMIYKTLVFALIEASFNTDEEGKLVYNHTLANMVGLLRELPGIPVNLICKPFTNHLTMNGYYNNDFDLLFELAVHRRIDPNEALTLARFALNVTMNDAIFSDLANGILGTILDRFSSEPSAQKFLLSAIKNAMAYLQKIEEREQASSKKQAGRVPLGGRGNGASTDTISTLSAYGTRRIMVARALDTLVGALPQSHFENAQIIVEEMVTATQRILPIRERRKIVQHTAAGDLGVYDDNIVERWSTASVLSRLVDAMQRRREALLDGFSTPKPNYSEHGTSLREEKGTGYPTPTPFAPPAAIAMQDDTPFDSPSRYAAVAPSARRTDLQRLSPTMSMTVPIPGLKQGHDHAASSVSRIQSASPPRWAHARKQPLPGLFHKGRKEQDSVSKETATSKESSVLLNDLSKEFEGYRNGFRSVFTRFCETGETMTVSNFVHVYSTILGAVPSILSKRRAIEIFESTCKPTQGFSLSQKKCDLNSFLLAVEKTAFCRHFIGVSDRVDKVRAMVNYCREFCTLRGFTREDDWRPRSPAKANERREKRRRRGEERPEMSAGENKGRFMGKKNRKNLGSVRKDNPGMKGVTNELGLGKQTTDLNQQLRAIGPFPMFSRLPANFTLKSTYTKIEDLHALDFSAGLVTDPWISGSRAAPSGKARHIVPKFMVRMGFLKNSQRVVMEILSDLLHDLLDMPTLLDSRRAYCRVLRVVPTAEALSNAVEIAKENEQEKENSHEGDWGDLELELGLAPEWHGEKKLWAQEVRRLHEEENTIEEEETLWAGQREAWRGEVEGTQISNESARRHHYTFRNRHIEDTLRHPHRKTQGNKSSSSNRKQPNRKQPRKDLRKKLGGVAYRSHGTASTMNLGRGRRRQRPLHSLVKPLPKEIESIVDRLTSEGAKTPRVKLHKRLERERREMRRKRIADQRERNQRAKLLHQKQLQNLEIERKLAAEKEAKEKELQIKRMKVFQRRQKERAREAALRHNRIKEYRRLKAERKARELKLARERKKLEREAQVEERRRFQQRVDEREKKAVEKRNQELSLARQRRQEAKRSAQRRADGLVGKRDNHKNIDNVHKEGEKQKLERELVEEREKKAVEKKYQELSRARKRRQEAKRSAQRRADGLVGKRDNNKSIDKIHEQGGKRKSERKRREEGRKRRLVKEKVHHQRSRERHKVVKKGKEKKEGLRNVEEVARKHRGGQRGDGRAKREAGEGGDDEGNGTDNDNKDGDEEDEEEEEGTDHGEDGNDDEDKAEKEEEEDTKRGKTTAKDPANSQIVAKAAANFATTSKPGRPSVTAVLNGKGLAQKTSKKGWSKVRKAVRRDTAFFMHEMEEKIHNDFMKMHLANEKNKRKKDLVDPTEDTGII